jgi:putative transposase
MPRLARIVVPGVAHHVVQRGNNRQDVFFVDDDRARYLALLKGQSEVHGLEILAWCLMTNHVHLVAVPDKPDSLARAIGRTDFLYTQYVNRLHGRSGHLWQNRFHSCALDEAHFWTALRYVEQNPLRAGLVDRATGYEWSSAVAHTTGEDDRKLLDMSKWAAMMDPGEWRRVLARQPAREELRALRKCTHRGWPLAGDRALAKIEKVLGRRVRPLRTGRPAGRKKP